MAANPCDVGTERSELEKAWPNFDFSQLDPVYPQKTGLYGPAEEIFGRELRLHDSGFLSNRTSVSLLSPTQGFLTEW
ncbi:hypothetical protein RRF57_005655 [Xylaria bambusicola]|uniref:Uncharacterized protein n=1 Tax=Xylaria bambusicola TaxID=326684 RepID=A0AAN7UD03_9PEZI